jgi:hypothetical protein
VSAVWVVWVVWPVALSLPSFLFYIQFFEVG